MSLNTVILWVEKLQDTEDSRNAEASSDINNCSQFATGAAAASAMIILSAANSKNV